MKRVMMALGCAAVTMFAGCMCDQMAARDLQPKESVECPEIRSECFSLSLENIATNRIELCGQHGFSGSKEVDEQAVRLLDEGSWPKTGDGESMGVSQRVRGTPIRDKN